MVALSHSAAGGNRAHSIDISTVFSTHVLPNRGVTTGTVYSRPGQPSETKWWNVSF